MKRLFVAAAAFAALLLTGLPVSAATTTIQPGNLIKTAGSTSVYYFGADGKRYVFPNSQTYFTWYSDFSSVKTVSTDQLSSLTIGGNVTYKPGRKLLKITSDPTVYAVSKDGILRAISSEAVASALYGSNWNHMIDDVPDAFFVNYKVGAPVTSASDYNQAVLMAGVPSINVDRLLVSPPPGFIDFRQTTGFNPASATVAHGTKMTWIVLDGSLPHVFSNSYAIPAGMPSLESGDLGMGATYSFTFSQAGAWTYKNNNFTAQSGKVIVQ